MRPTIVAIRRNDRHYCRLARVLHQATLDVRQSGRGQQGQQRGRRGSGQSGSARGGNITVVDDTPGKFTNPKLAELYGNLVQAGLASAEGAYKVGVQIEELDIAGLKEGLAVTTHRDIQMVFQNLLRASQTHLTAFTSRL